MNIIELKGLNKAFGDTKVLDNINLYIKENEFLTLLGPSGCGKTTTLRIIGGFETADSGEVLFDGKDIKDIPPYKRNINTIFQKYSLFRHLDVFDNVAFGLNLKKVDKKKIKEDVMEMLNFVNLEGFEHRSIDSLSGGQQQRVAIARALVNKPKVLLLDEPLGALDLKLRKSMQIELKKIQRKVGITFIFVTHDQEEALTMSDTIVVMNGGQIQQIGTPLDIYNEPKNEFVARFIGETNIIEGIFIEDNKVEFSNHIFDSLDKGFKKGEKVDVVVRPEDIEIVDAEKGMIKGVVKELIFKGVHWEMAIDVDGYMYKVDSTVDRKVGEEVGLVIVPDNMHLMKKEEAVIEEN
ncbi:polyamine ABC transporter, ATP-binding protein [Helcococcus kunzii ATCC 51366]|uniref:Spermidine/putrescine import ATP-binding protein PotA n=1 Tax=Helcococcus kunzii ATCC 51366 TaxID=883114 RepID=H3NMB1_9FIRM|nr:spermidine/putrescine ABC transporter ATP-binding protein [Helcococcus kunzii]EHR35520.1 polyamine ABC transporter, ATP-binding protein [Helcococcus kunzii ATCC 51366]